MRTSLHFAGALAVLLLLVAAGCADRTQPGDSKPRATKMGPSRDAAAAEPAPPSAPAVAAPAQAPTSPAGQQAKADKPTETEDETESENEPEKEPAADTTVAKEPEVVPPKYLAILEPIQAGRPSRAEARIENGNVLELKLDNVKRLRIMREGMPISRQHSVILRLDNQRIEWTPRYATIELERSPNGAWTVDDSP